MNSINIKKCSKDFIYTKIPNEKYFDFSVSIYGAQFGYHAAFLTKIIKNRLPYYKYIDNECLFLETEHNFLKKKLFSDISNIALVSCSEESFFLGVTVQYAQMSNSSFLVSKKIIGIERSFTSLDKIMNCQLKNINFDSKNIINIGFTSDTYLAYKSFEDKVNQKKNQLSILIIEMGIPFIFDDKEVDNYDIVAINIRYASAYPSNWLVFYKKNNKIFNTIFKNHYKSYIESSIIRSIVKYSQKPEIISKKKKNINFLNSQINLLNKQYQCPSLGSSLNYRIPYDANSLQGMLRIGNRCFHQGISFIADQQFIYISLAWNTNALHCINKFRKLAQILFE